MATVAPALTDEEEYNSDADEDFNPDVANKADGDVQSSSEEEEGETTSSGKNKKRKGLEDALDFDNSGDEMTISKARKKKKRKTGEENIDDDEEGGEGGLVKTRAQRKAEGKEKKPLATAGSSGVDVDSLWAQMSGRSKPIQRNDDTPTANGEAATSSTEDSERLPAIITPTNSRISEVLKMSDTEPMLTIRRTYEFAGQKMEEERSVPASSAEAKLYIEEQTRQTRVPPPTSQKAGLKRPKKRASMFDTPTNNDQGASATTVMGPKLNTVEKSKLDWASHVDQEGISDELDEHKRAKGGYLGRMDFLSRMDAKRESDMADSK